MIGNSVVSRASEDMEETFDSVISSEARNLVVPDRAKAETPPPLSFRSEARNLVFSLRSDPAEISPFGRDDSGGWPK